MRLTLPTPMDPSEAVAKAVCDAAMTKEAALIITLTFTGTSARLISKFRPRCPVSAPEAPVTLRWEDGREAACAPHR